MTRTLNISDLNQDFRIGGIGSRRTNLSYTPHSMRTAIEDWASENMVKKSNNFGFAMADFRSTGPDWDNPTDLTLFVAGWGHEKSTYIANAVRKLRPAIRTGRDTLDIYRNDPQLFKDTVESQEDDGSYAWGDFPFGGAVHVNFAGIKLLGAVSGLTQAEDHAVAAAILNMIGLKLYLLDHQND